MSWIHRLFSVRRRPVVSPPPPVDPASLAVAQDRDSQAAEVLARVEAEDHEVDTRAQRAQRIHRENNLGPAFMRVLGERRNP